MTARRGGRQWPGHKVSDLELALHNLANRFMAKVVVNPTAAAASPPPAPGASPAKAAGEAGPAAASNAPPVAPRSEQQRLPLALWPLPPATAGISVAYLVSRGELSGSAAGTAVLNIAMSGTSFLLTLAWLGLQIADSARRRIKEKSLVRKSVSFMRKSLRIPGGRATKFTREQTAV